MNWETFLIQHNIDFVTSGPNTKRGEFSVNCPFCGDDPSHHLGINPTNDRWGCWRNAQHAGRKPEYLIKGLLNCSLSQARLVVRQYSRGDPTTLSEAINLLTGDDMPDKILSPYQHVTLRLPPNFKEIKNKGTTKRFWNYLKKRGFGGKLDIDDLQLDIDDLVLMYGLKCCNVGTWKDRIIIPIYKNDELVTWTSRALQDPIKAPRYKTLSEDEGALRNIKDCCYIEDALLDPRERDPDLIFVVEGPFDALNIDFVSYILKHKIKGKIVRSTCIFGTSMTLTQAETIARMTERSKVVLLLDPGTTEQMFQSLDILQRYGVVAGQIPDTIEDPGAMTRKEIINLVAKNT